MCRETAPNEVAGLRLQSCFLVYLQLPTKTKQKKNDNMTNRMQQVRDSHL